jgi:hypothetical protein
MNKRQCAAAAIFGSSIFFATMQGASALTIYPYQGNTFTTVTDASPPGGSYTTGMNITGSFEVAGPLISLSYGNINASIIDFSFFDGRNTISLANAASYTFDVATDASGKITRWYVDINTPFPSTVGQQYDVIILAHNALNIADQDFAETLECTGVGSKNGDCSSLSDTGVTRTPGNWSTPLPAALPMFGAGLGALGLLGWRRRRRTQKSPRGEATRAGLPGRSFSA